MSDPDRIPITRALLSVSDKTGIVELAQALRDRGVALLSTGGTCRLLRERGIAVTEVSEHTGFPEMMDGRVKTLHPRIHAGILARRGQDEAALDAQGIVPIDLVVVNLYPFEQTVADPACSREQAVENIDIGGPTLLRAAAKNHRFVTVLVNSADYQRVTAEMADRDDGATTYQTRFDLAVRAYEHTAAYDAAIANYFGRQLGEGDGGERFPRTLNLQLHRAEAMRYGENPHQQAAFYVEKPVVGLGAARQWQGKAMSFNNVADTDAALECVGNFSGPACVIVKHANPCGVAEADTIAEAYELAFATDPESAFGGIIAFNRPLDGATAGAIVERQFVEVIIAPEVAPEALAATADKKNVRVLSCGAGDSGGDGGGGGPTSGLDYKRVDGGLLVQDRDQGMLSAADFTTVSRRQPSPEQLQDLGFAWKVAKFVKSNAIVYARQGRTIGVGAGQMSRINSARIAAIKAEHAGLQVEGSVMASDAFFPFRDGIDMAAEAGISAVVQPGGSLRDQEVIDAADEHDMVMVFTGMRHFRH